MFEDDGETAQNGIWIVINSRIGHSEGLLV